MANRYVRSTDGSDADGGTTWALAKATLTGVAAIDTAGDNIYVSDNHAESSTSALTFNFAGTFASPTRLLCVDDSAEPPTALASTATVTTTTGVNISIAAAGLYAYGITFVSSALLTLCSSAADSFQTYENCKFSLTATGSAGVLYTAGGNNNGYQVRLLGCTFKFGHINNSPITLRGDVHIRGGSVDGSGSTPGNGVFAFDTDRTAGRGLIEGVDFSGLASTMTLVRGTSSKSSGKIIFRGCRLPASWSGSLCTSAVSAPGQRYEMWNCDSGDTNYRIWIEDYAGSIKQSSAIYKDAFGGGPQHSWIMASSANAEYPLILLESPELFADNATTGSSVTATVEIVTDGVTLKDDEAWLEVMHMGTSGVPLGTWVRDCKADVLATAANQATSTEAWTTTGLSSPTKQKLSVSVTPQEAGYILGRVVLAKASTTVYVDPELKLS